MYRYYQIMICLLKFDFFCFTGVTMQVRVPVDRNSAREADLANLHSCSSWSCRTTQ